MITKGQFKRIFPIADESFIPAINKTINLYRINNPAMFLAQIGHESGNLTVLIENLNYSADRLLKIFPKYFTRITCNDYARQPQKIANRVYANRMGNGSEASGDGWKYRGKGAIQVTGRDNHAAFAKSVNLTIDQAVEYMLTPEGAIMSAGWFWDYRNINSVSSDIVKTTAKINGGDNGLADRRERYHDIQKILTLNTPSAPETTFVPPVPMTTVNIIMAKKGDQSSYVKDLQQMLIRKGIKLVADGDFGEKTENAVKEFQRWAKLPTTGLIDTNTLNELMKL